jgi:hypothetical protein
MKAKTRKRNFQYFRVNNGYINPFIYYNPNRIIDFWVAGIRYREKIEDYEGEFMGRLIPEPTNIYDPQAIRVEHADGHHIGYVPKEKIQQIWDFKGELPCDCYCFVKKIKEEWGDIHYVAKCFVSEYPLDE